MGFHSLIIALLISSTLFVILFSNVMLKIKALHIYPIEFRLFEYASFTIQPSNCATISCQKKKQKLCVTMQSANQSIQMSSWPSITLTKQVAAPIIFLRVFLKEHKLHNLIKREIHILTITIIKKHTNT